MKKNLNQNVESLTIANNTSKICITKKAIGGATINLVFTVKCVGIKSWENMFLTGSHLKLGNWIAEKAIQMVTDEKRESFLWTTTIKLSAEESRNLLCFRYFTGYYLQNNSAKSLVVSKWESQYQPRCVLPSVETINGICRANHIDFFGEYGGKKVITDGWLSNPQQKTIILMLRGETLRFYKLQHAQRLYYIKITAIDAKQRQFESIDGDFDETNQNNSFILPRLFSVLSTEVSNINNDEYPFFKEQELCGTLFENNKDFLMFKTHSFSVETLAFRIELFVNLELNNKNINEIEALSQNLSKSFLTKEEKLDFFCNKKTCKKVEQKKLNLKQFAIAYSMPDNMTKGNGEILLPILSRNQLPLGQLKVNYLYVNALTIPQTMKVSYTKQWKKRQTIEIGHRGMGNSYTKSSNVRENTLYSLNQAAKNGADFVEFDVQLSKDRKAVIFHDFHVHIFVATRLKPTNELKNLSDQTLNKISSIHEKNFENLSENSKVKNINEFYKIAVKDLTLRQLRLINMSHCSHTDNNHSDKLKITPTDPTETPEHNPFPTLVDALTKIDVDLGFNIEIKYPMLCADGSNECENYFNQNEYVDIILNIVLKYGGFRRIVFSSFDPDICLMVALKQNKYPVLFLTIGPTLRYIPYKDERSNSSRLSVNYALSINILGVNFHSEDILNDATQITRAHKNNLVSFVWGEDLEKQENINYFRKEIMVDAIIYDGVGAYEKKQNIFVVEREAKHALFLGKLNLINCKSNTLRNASFDNLSNAMIAYKLNQKITDVSCANKQLTKRFSQQNKCGTLEKIKDLD